MQFMYGTALKSVIIIVLLCVKRNTINYLRVTEREPSGPLTTSSLLFLVLAAAILNSVNAPHTALLVVAAMQYSLQHQLPSLHDTAGFCSHLHFLC